MKNLAVVLMSVMVLLVLSMGQWVNAAPPDGGPGVPCERQCARMPDGPGPGAGPFPGGHLGFTKEQHEKMRALEDKFRSETHDLRYDVRIKHLEAEKFFTNPRTSEAVLAEKLKELGALEHTLRAVEVAKQIEWRKLLTPEQIQKLEMPFPPMPPERGPRERRPMMDHPKPMGDKP